MATEQPTDAKPAEASTPPEASAAAVAGTPAAAGTPAVSPGIRPSVPQRPAPDAARPGGDAAGPREDAAGPGGAAGTAATGAIRVPSPEAGPAPAVDAVTAATAGPPAAGTGAVDPAAHTEGVRAATGTGTVHPDADEGPVRPAGAVRVTLPTERPPGVPPDPWRAYATTEERTPGRVRRGLGVVRQALISEYALVTYLGLVLAAALTWPTLRYPAHTLPGELGEPARQAWQIAWSGHILRTDPAKLWQANAYFPVRNAFAFGDSLLGYAPAGMLGGGPLAATLRYNILFVLAHALLAIGGYALVRQLGAGRTGATVAAVAFAYAPWRLAQDGHLDIVSAGGIPLALAMLARGHGWSLRHGFRPERGHAGWVAAGWLVAAWQISLGFSLGVPFAYVLAGVCLVLLIAVPIRRLRTRRAVLGWPVILTDLAGAVIVAAVGALIVIPYLTVRFPGGTAAIAANSAPWRAVLIAPAQSLIWGDAHAAARDTLSRPGEMTLLPGFALISLALVGLLFSVWTRWQRLLLAAGVAVGVILAVGTTFYGGRWTYLPLFGHLPGSLDLRVPGRLMLWVTLLLAVLAAGAAAEFARRVDQLAALRMPPWPGPWLRLATLVPLLIVLIEAGNLTPHPVVPAQPAALRTVSGPMLVLPTSDDADRTVQLWSTSRFQPVANGGGEVAAARQAELRAKVASFPDEASVQYLRGLGVTSVLLLRARAGGTPWERAGDVPVDALGIKREDLDARTVLFRLG